MKIYQNELARIVDIEENRYIFENGTCEVENKDHIAILKELGYLVEEIQEEIKEETPKKTTRAKKKVDEWD